MQRFSPASHVRQMCCLLHYNTEVGVDVNGTGGESESRCMHAGAGLDLGEVFFPNGWVRGWVCDVRLEETDKTFSALV